VRQDFPLMNPCWELLIISCFYRNSTSFSFISDFVTLHGTDVNSCNQSVKCIYRIRRKRNGTIVESTENMTGQARQKNDLSATEDGRWYGKNMTGQSKAKQRCVMGVGVCLYAQLVQTKNQQCKSAIILQCYHPHLSDFCSRPRLTQFYNHIT